ncbi:helix-turn-helix transcriptional regulator [Microbispora amethystogenes]|uniref:helix-turn-helix domain-containing protein n=1 Tax=Microbispora amethystogenes TaxID=1427754 RepID=UPI0033EEE800
MNEPSTSVPFGERVRFYREAAGMSRPVFGELCGKSGAWAKSIETGAIGMPGIRMLLRMAELLNVNLGDLTGLQRISETNYTKMRHEKASEIARLLAGYPLVTGDSEPVPAAELAANVAQAWQVWHGSTRQRDAIAVVLPRLLEDARIAAKLHEGLDRRSALASLAQVYHLAQLYLAFQPMPEMIYLTGDRAMQAAQDADSPKAVASAAWYLNHVFRDAGEQAETRIELAHQACRLLSPERDENDRSLYGLLHLAIALSYARTGRQGDAERHLDEADRAAESLTSHHPWLLFGRGMVDAYSVTIYNDLAHAYEATRQVNRLDLHRAVPSLTRNSFHLTEAARAYHLRKEPIAAMTLLRQAYEMSPDTSRYNLFTRSTVLQMMTGPVPAVRDDARTLARKLRLPEAA